MATAYFEDADRQPFGAWLVKQTGARSFVAQLADSAAKDRTFPRQGTVEDARKWLQAQRASGDDWEALDDAESAWLAWRSPALLNREGARPIRGRLWGRSSTRGQTATPPSHG